MSFQPTSGKAPITELIGVYHADGGPIGEAKYVIGKLLGTAHCALCDITHSPLRRKPEWDRMVHRLGVPVALLHLNEMPRDVAAVVAEHGSPIVLARTAAGQLGVLVPTVRLDALNGSVDAFETAVRDAVEVQDGTLAGPAAAG